MKNSVYSNLSKAAKSIATALMIAALFIFSPALANDNIKTTPIKVKYVGSSNNSPVFQIEFQNPEEEVYLLLKDTDGNILYAETVKDKNYSRKIRLDGEDTHGMKLVLSLRSRNGAQTQTFQINKNVRMVEDVEVARIQ